MKTQWIHRGKIISILIVLSLMLVDCTPQIASGEKLEEGFLNPPIATRPLAFWDWLNGYVDTARLVYELEEIKAKGMQGVFIWDVGALSDPDKIIPAGPAFLGEESLDYISIALKAGSRLGLNLGMIASSSWNAGGDWIDEEDASKELLSTQQVVEGPSKKRITISKPKSKQDEEKICSLITSIAIPYSGSANIYNSVDQSVALDAFTSEDEYIDWDIPTGMWTVISFFMCNTGQPLECPSPNSVGLMIDHLSKQATRNHFDTILERLATISSADNHLKFLEVDSYEVWPAVDWTPGLLEEFETRYGYDPAPFLPLLQGFTYGDTVVGQRFTGDYKRLVSDLIIENHFAQSVDIVKESGMKMFAEAGHGGYARVDPLKAFGNCDIPMGEFWNRQRFWVTKEAASGAHIYGKEIVASETLTGWNHWQHGPSDYKQLCDIAFCEGLNQIFFHTFAHNPEIAGKPGFAYHAGEHINVNTTWWNMARPFMDYLSRCSYMLRQGNFVGDACLYYGDQAPNLVPPKRIDPNITPIYGDDQCLHCGQPKPVNVGSLPGYDYDYINADIITTTLSVENGNLVLPSGISYRVMLLPDRLDISLEVLKSLETLVFDGATIIGRKPERTTSLKNFPECDEEAKSISEKLWGKTDGETVFLNSYGKGKVYWGKSVKEVLEEMNVRPDFEVTGIDNSSYLIDYIHRQTETEDIYFISNSSPASQNFTCTFRIPSNKVPELWDAETGLIQRDIEYSKTSGGISIELIMDPLASRFVVFRDRKSGSKDTGLPKDLQFAYSGKDNESTSIDISKNWKVDYNPEMGGPLDFQMEKLVSWSDIELEGIKHYSGTATYTKDCKIEEEKLSTGAKIYLTFENIQEMARIYINGNDCGILWTPPYSVNITKYLKPGINEISIDVTNTWNNRLVGDMKNPEGKAYTKTNAKYKFSKTSPLLKSGLIGKAEISFN